MGRVVYSFSLPEESEAAWLLKKYKREGKVLSHIIQKAIECDSKELHRLEKELEWEKKTRARSCRILHEIFDVGPDDFKFLHHKPTALYPQQPIEVLDRARIKLKSQTEWTLNKVVWE